MENQARTGTRPRRGLNDAQRTVYFSFFAYGTPLATRVGLPPGNRAGEGVRRNALRCLVLVKIGNERNSTISITGDAAQLSPRYRRLATFLGPSPDTAISDDLRRFQIEQQQDGIPVPTMNSIVSALRFFFTHTVDRPDLARRPFNWRTRVSCQWCSAATRSPASSTPLPA